MPEMVLGLVVQCSLVPHLAQGINADSSLISVWPTASWQTQRGQAER